MASILLLEDEESVNRGIEFILEKEGYTVYSAGTIKEARKFVREKEIDLMICDINLPDGNSLDFIKQVREKSSVHIICLTALDGEFDQIAGYEAGADDYITKPFSLSVFVLKVNAYFNRNKQTVSDVVKSGIWQFHLREMKAKGQGRESTFTKTEWKMLRLFLEHPKQILSKRQILEQLFDADGEFVDENTVAVNIRRLREKIEPEIGKPQYIRNVRGLGYVWDQECVKGQEVRG